MNMSHTHSTKKSSYSHLSATERGEISAYLKMGKQAAEIARLLGRHRSTISREIKRGSVTQVQDKNGKLIYSTVYFPDSGQRVYEENRKKKFLGNSHIIWYGIFTPYQKTSIF